MIDNRKIERQTFWKGEENRGGEEGMERVEKRITVCYVHEPTLAFVLTAICNS